MNLQTRYELTIAEREMGERIRAEVLWPLAVALCLYFAAAHLGYAAFGSSAQQSGALAESLDSWPSH